MPKWDTDGHPWTKFEGFVLIYEVRMQKKTHFSLQSRSKYPDCNEFQTRCVLPPTKCTGFQLISESMLTKIRKLRTDGHTNCTTRPLVKLAYKIKLRNHASISDVKPMVIHVFTIRYFYHLPAVPARGTLNSIKRQSRHFAYLTHLIYCRLWVNLISIKQYIQ